MDTLTDLLKKSTVVKNDQGYIAAINYLKALIEDNDLKNKDAVRCAKKIASFIKHEKSISINEANSFFQNIISTRILNRDDKYELFFSLSEFYQEKKEIDLARAMANGAIAFINPDEFGYLLKFRNCYYRLAHIARLSNLSEIEKSLQYLYGITCSCLFEVASETGLDLYGDMSNYIGYKESDFEEDIYDFNDLEGYFDSALRSLGILEKKKEIINDIHKFATFDLPLTMGIPQSFLEGKSKKLKNYEMKPFYNYPIIVDFANKLYLKYYSIGEHA